MFKSFIEELYTYHEVLDMIERKDKTRLMTFVMEVYNQCWAMHDKISFMTSSEGKSITKSLLGV